MLHHQNCPFVEQRPCSKGQQALGIKHLPLVGRIEKHDIKRHALSLEQIQGFGQIRLEDSKSLRHLETREVLANDGTSFPRMIDEINETSASADGFNADAAHPCETVQKCSALHARAEYVKQGLAKFVAGGPNACGRFAFELTAAKLAGDHTHGSPSCLILTSSWKLEFPMGCGFGSKRHLMTRHCL